MGKQTGLIQLEGSVGNVTFYKSGDGAIAKIKAGPSKSKIQNSPTFEKLRQQNSEFGRAGLASRLFKKVFRTLIKGNADSAVSRRLHKKMVEVIQADLINPRGKRNVVDGEAELLRGFEFNKEKSLDVVLAVSITTAIDRVTGGMKLHIDPFIPVNDITVPAGTTHYRVFMGSASIDFEKEEFVTDFKSTADLPWNEVATAAIDLTTTVTPNSTHPLFLLVGIQYCDIVNGAKTLSNLGSLSVVMVSGE